MATELALARSFYSWTTRLVLQEGLPKTIVPEFLPTTNPALLRVVEKIAPQLKTVQQQERLAYWKNIFLSLQESAMATAPLTE